MGQRARQRQKRQPAPSPIAPRDTADASPSVRPTSGAVHDADPSSSDGHPACCTVDAAG
jgi:hypothetical protein